MIPAISIILMAIALGTWGRLLIADALLWMHLQNSDIRRIASANWFWPWHTKIATTLTALMVKTGKASNAFEISLLALLRYDGMIGVETGYITHAIVCLQYGFVDRAKRYLCAGLLYDPENQAAKQLLAEVNGCLNQKQKN